MVWKKALLAAGAAGLALAAGAAFARRGASGWDCGREWEGLISSEDAAAVRDWATPLNILAAMVRDGVLTQEQADGITAWRSHLQRGPAEECPSGLAAAA